MGFLPVRQVPDMLIIKKGLIPFKKSWPGNFRLWGKCNGIVVFGSKVKEKVVLFCSICVFAILFN